ncbi:hypothetical protein Zmor_003642 [Zophobas morio]|uniref:Uncharacterized protein n=1 Tax=Zophobas morio TaxID=2755281 RepID=A0AA38HPQ5_9CUCU|nr:hypothetical protein Zmor_003642 [Zophobas morio]
MVNIPIKLGQMRTTCRAAVVEKFDYPLILGMPFLTEHKAILDMTNKNKKELTARQMWEEFLNEEMGKAFLTKIKQQNCGHVAEIATHVYGKMSEDIHNYFHEGIRKVYLVKSELSHCDYTFLKNVCLSLPLSPSDIVSLNNKSEFVFSPQKM